MDFKSKLKNVKWFSGYRSLPEAYIRIQTPGVSTIIGDQIPDPELEKWIAEVGKEKADQITQAAWHRGAAMHIFIQNFLNKFQELKDPTAALEFSLQTSPKQAETEENVPAHKISEGRELFYKFYYSEFARDFIKTLGTELNLYSPYLFYRGKADWFYQKKIYDLSISDFKTASKPILKGSTKEEKYKHQLGAYTMALEDMYQEKGKNIKISYASIICMQTRSDNIQVIECINQELEEYKQKFKTLCLEWHKKNEQHFLFESKK